MSEKKDFIQELKDSGNDGGMKWPPAWIISFSDLMTLLLTFFIFFFSVTTLEELPKVLRQLRHEAGIIVPIAQNEFPVPQKTTLIEKRYIKRESEVIENFEKYLKKAGLAKDIKLEKSEKEIKVTIANPILFASGKSDIKPQALPVLKKLAELFKNNDNLIRVEGHTDNVPIHTDKFPSNWELSSARAISVIKFFIKSADISPTRFEALGYGEFKATALNDTEEGRAKNRRVEIKIIQKSS
jgi:chemotaxis protein MotB